MAVSNLSSRVRAYMARQRAWLEQEIAGAELLLANVAAMPELDHPLAAAQASMNELENLEREQRGLLAEWKDESIPLDEQDFVRGEAIVIAELAARLSILRGQVAQAIAESQVAIVGAGKGLRAARGGVRKYHPGVDGTAGHVDRNA